MRARRAARSKEFLQTRGLEMKWISLLAIVVVISSDTASADDGLFGLRSNLRTVEHRAPAADAPLAMPPAYEDFPAYAGYGSYHGLGYQGSCCEHASAGAVKAWDGYCDGKGHDSGHGLSHRCWLAEGLRRRHERRQARHGDCHHGCDSGKAGHHGVFGGHHGGMFGHGGHGGRLFQGRRGRGSDDLYSPHDVYPGPAYYGPEIYSDPGYHDYPPSGSADPMLQLPPPPPLPSPSSLQQPADPPQLPGFFGQDRAASREARNSR
jgi:hypothetical protein